MKTLQKFGYIVMLIVALQASAQETTNKTATSETTAIDSVQLPSFEELSISIASDYSKVRESLPNLSNIGSHVQKEIRRGMFDQTRISYTFRNIVNETSILPTITPMRFQLRNNLNNIMFNGFDANQLHLNGSYKGTN